MKAPSCCGGFGLDRALANLWARKLFSQHPDWSPARVHQRAMVEAMKGKQP